MASDLVNRLRDLRHLHAHQSFEVVAHVGEEAAAEIERLEAKIKRLESLGDAMAARLNAVYVPEAGVDMQDALARKEADRG